MVHLTRIRKQPTQFNSASNHSLHSRYRHTTKPLATIDHVKFPRNLGRACPYDTFVCCLLVSTISFVYLPGGILDASHRRSSALPDVSIKREDSHQLFIRTLKEQGLNQRGLISLSNSAVPHSSLGLSTRSMLNPYATKEELLRCITDCPNIENLALRSTQLYHLGTIMYETTIAPPEEEDGRQMDLVTNVKKLTVIDSATWLMASHPGLLPLEQIFSNITHLTVINSDQPSIHLPLRPLTSLTHVALPYNGDLPFSTTQQITMQVIDTAETILSNAGVHIKMLIMHLREEQLALRQEDSNDMPLIQSLALEANRRNERIHILPMNRKEISVFRSWEKEARGDSSVWDDAADLLRESGKTPSRNSVGRRLSLVNGKNKCPLSPCGRRTSEGFIIAD